MTSEFFEWTGLLILHNRSYAKSKRRENDQKQLENDQKQQKTKSWNP